MKRFLLISLAVLMFPFQAKAQEPVNAEEGELPAETVDGDPPMPLLGHLDAPVMEILEDGTCFQWVGTALQAGWQAEELPRLMRIMWRESRCLPDACGETDSPHIRKCRDWGLMQINDYSWKTTIRSLGLDIEQMHDPYWNLWFARWLYNYSSDVNGDGWQPWTPIKQEATQ